MSVNGNVSDSLIGAGLVSNAGAFDLAWMAANDAFVNGSLIASISAKGNLTSSAGGPDVPFGVGSYEILKGKLGGTGIGLVYTEV